MGLPPARVDSSRRRLLAYLRTIGPVVLVLGAGWFACRKCRGPSFEDQQRTSARETNTAAAYADYAKYHQDPDGVRDDLAKLHTVARDHIRAAGARPEALEPMFAALLARVDRKLRFAGEPTVDRASFEQIRVLLAKPGSEVAQLADHLATAWGCSEGFTEAFAELTGSDVIAFATDAAPQPVLTVRWKTRASGSAYVQPRLNRIYPGIAIEGELELAGMKQTFAAAPAADIQFTSYGMPSFSAGGNDDDFARALVTSACKQAAYVLIEKQTGWKPEAKPVPGLADIEKKCDGGDGNACHEIAVAYRDGTGVPADRARAAKLFKAGCDTSSVDAARGCIAGAALALASPSDDARADARFMLQRGCEWHHHGDACERYGALLIEPRDGAAPTPYAVGEAMPALARGCDLGARAACARAAAALATTDFAGGRSHGAAAVLAQRGCADAKCPDADRFAKLAARDTTVFGAPLKRGADRVFDVRYGDWYRSDTGRAVAWVASASDREAVTAQLGAHRTRVYSVAELPYGVVPPPGTRTVWAVFGGEPMWKDDQACTTECKTGQSYEMMEIHGCVCLPLRPRD